MTVLVSSLINEQIFIVKFFSFNEDESLVIFVSIF